MPSRARDRQRLARRFSGLARRSNCGIRPVAWRKAHPMRAGSAGRIIHRISRREAYGGCPVIWRLIKLDPTWKIIPWLAATNAAIWWFAGGIGGVSSFTTELTFMLLIIVPGFSSRYTP